MIAKIAAGMAAGLLSAVVMISPEQGFGAQELRIRLEDPTEIGRKDPIFGSIAAVCEDEAGNFYVVDQLDHKVFKFSSTGEPLLSFGQPGQGPGDFQRPNRISITAEGNLAVADEMLRISFLKPDGTFVERITLAQGLAPGYIGEDRFYAWRWSPEGREQILLNSEGRILRTFYSLERELFSISVPDLSGRAVMFNFGRPAYSPGLLFAQNGRLSALARSDEYRIQVLDEKGRSVATIERRQEPLPLTRRERLFFREEFEELGRMRGWPQSVVRDILKKIPQTKTFFDHMLLTPSQILVFRVRPDITREAGDFPVDVFSIQGTYRGQGNLPEKPIFASQTRMYFVRSDAEGNVWLAVRDYSFK